MTHREFIPGEQVRTHTGYTGTIYKKAKRAAADIKVAQREDEKDLTPYTVKMDGLGHFSTYRGHELTALDPCGGSGFVGASGDPCPSCYPSTT